MSLPSLQSAPAQLRRRPAKLRLRSRSFAPHDESGFSLPELPVVCVIVGALAALAIPALAGQKTKAVDAQAKALAHTAQTAAEAIAADHSGSYKTVTPAALNKYESQVGIAASAAAAYPSSATGAKDEYSVTANAPDGNEFKISRNALGASVANARALS